MGAGFQAQHELAVDILVCHAKHGTGDMHRPANRALKLAMPPAAASIARLRILRSLGFIKKIDYGDSRGKPFFVRCPRRPHTISRIPRARLRLRSASERLGRVGGRCSFEGGEVHQYTLDNVLSRLELVVHSHKAVRHAGLSLSEGTRTGVLWQPRRTRRHTRVHAALPPMPPPPPCALLGWRR